MIRRLHFGLALLAMALGTDGLLMAGPAQPPPVQDVETADSYCCQHSNWSWFGWFQGQPKVRDEGYERRKDACRFIFGPSGPYLRPNLYQPWPPVAGYCR